MHTFPCVGSFPSLQQQPFPTKKSFRELPVKERDRAKGSGEAECCSWFCQESLLFMKSLGTGCTWYWVLPGRRELWQCLEAGCPKSSHCHPGMLRCFSSTEILGSVTQTKHAARCSPLWCSSSRSHSGQSTWVGRMTILSLLSSLLTVLYGSQWPLHSLPVLSLCGASSKPCLGILQDGGHVAQIFYSRLPKVPCLGTAIHRWWSAVWLNTHNTV